MSAVAHNDRTGLSPLGGVDKKPLPSCLGYDPFYGSRVGIYNRNNTVLGQKISESDTYKLHTVTLFNVLNLFPDFFQLGFNIHNKL